MTAQSTEQTQFEGFDWETVSGDQDESAVKLLRNRFPTIQDHLEELAPDDRDWFHLPAPETSDLFIKVFRYDSFLKRLRYTLLNNQARKEWNHLLRLETAGSPAPSPIALGERFKNGLLKQCILVTEQISGGETLRSFLETHYAASYWPQLRASLWRELARTTGALAESGFYHRDYHDQNLIVTSRATADKAPPDDLQIWVTDVHRASSYTILDESSLMKMLAFLIYSMSSTVPIWESRRFYRFLQREEPLQEDLPDWSTCVEYLVERRREHRTNRVEDGLKENDRFAVTKLDGNVPRTVHHPRSVSPENIRSWVEVLQTSDEREALTIVKQRSDGRVLRYRDPERNHVIMKKTTGRPVRRKLERAAGRSKARRSWRNARGLRVRDIRTPEPLALIEPTNPFSGEPSYFVQSYLEGSSRLDHHAKKLGDKRDRHEPNPELRGLIRSAAKFIRYLHREGIFHKDMKANNILLREEDAPPFSFYLIDLDRVSFYDRPLPSSPRIRNLIQLNASLPEQVTGTERWRAWKLYLNDGSVPFSSPQQALEEIMTGTRERTDRWP